MLLMLISDVYCKIEIQSYAIVTSYWVEVAKEFLDYHKNT